ncbi:MAG: BREX-1 system adenine-specific DNA-methyltransferase PglX, partial [Clostridia bacterium]|nr:BREX-1 system adenine-specific DNA-methyltransferase PglX [Clostridia bacterium]
MNKNAIKRYAIWARNELIDRVSHRAAVYGITDEDHGDMNADSVNGSILTVTEKRQRQALIRKVNAQGYQIVMEEVAFTWFNRFAALRFMEVNGYLPSHVRVFTNDEGEFKPQMLTEAIHLELDGLDRKIVYALEKTNRGEDLFKYLLITQCNALSAILPGLFQKIDDYTELLLPDFLLREGSVIQQMVELIPEEDWTDQVQIIGWLYQYYNTEPKDKVFGRKSGEKIKKEEIPAATQLFTPDWIVRYMVENSLGRLWLEGHPNDELKSGWKYYLDEAQQEPEVAAQLGEIRKEYAALKPEDIRVIDPCMGSGHILCYLFDVLVQIYEAYGYSVREAIRLIVEKNLYGLDLDERAGQLAYFAVMMKARQYDRRFFSRDVQPNIGHFQGLSYNLEDFPDPALQSLVKAFENADEYGSLLEISEKNIDIEAAANAVDAYTDDFLVGL